MTQTTTVQSPTLRREAGPDQPEDPSKRAVRIGMPVGEDGADVHALIAACPPLDENSLYANLLQCTDFRGTCAAARIDGALLGWVSGYIPPEAGDTYFLWQVAVHEKARGRKLARQLVSDILGRPACRNVKYIKTTITPDNEASWALFRSIARWLDAPLNEAPHFDRDKHFGGQHASEIMVTIGPFDRPAAAN